MKGHRLVVQPHPQMGAEEAGKELFQFEPLAFVVPSTNRLPDQPFEVHVYRNLEVVKRLLARHSLSITEESPYEWTDDIDTVKVLWNGGWDVYMVNPDSIRDMTAEEMAEHEAGNSRYFPTFSDGLEYEWLKGKFLTSPANQAVVPIGENQCVAILRHVAGGE